MLAYTFQYLPLQSTKVYVSLLILLRFSYLLQKNDDTIV